MNVQRLEIQLTTFARNLISKKNIKPHKVILTTAQCTSNLGKHPKDEDIHNVCGALNNYRDNSTGRDYIWGTVCQYFFDCHLNKKLIQPKTALNLVLIECKQFIKARPINPISKYLVGLLKNLK